MSKQARDPAYVKWASIIGLIMGIISLYFSFEANRLAGLASDAALRQVTGQIELIYFEDWVSFNRNQNTLVCTYQARLSNQGGAPETIVDFDVSVTYNNQSVKFASDGRNIGDLRDHELRPVTQYTAYIWKRALPLNSAPSQEQLGEYLSEFPLKVDPYSVEDIYASIHLDFDPSSNYNFVSDNYRDPSSYGYSPNNLINTWPVDLQLHFFTASGRTVIGPNTPCVYIHYEQH